MPKVSSEKLYSNFIKGLITEANPLTYPENSSLDEDNFVLERNGSRSRRLGIDFEVGAVQNITGLTATQIAGSKQSFHRWESPAGATDISIGVIRIYNQLWFVNLLAATPSAALLNGGNPVIIEGLSNSNIETTVIQNSLVVVGKDLSSPVLLQYSKSTQTIVQTILPILIRDLFGMVDNLEIDKRPSTLSKEHKYNLMNQGWNSKISVSCGSTTPATNFTSVISNVFLEGIITDIIDVNSVMYAEPELPVSEVASNAIECTKTQLGVYPSNADIWTLGKVGDSASANFEKYDPATMRRNTMDNTEAPKGSFIIDAFNRGTSRSKLTGIENLALDKELGKLSTIASYAGRVFYSGVVSQTINSDAKSPNYSGFIFFSQVVTSLDKLSKCYQDADPTSPNISDMIDTDGGTIQIPEATKIIKIMATQSSLLIFAENGVWEVYGDTGGFIATSFQLAKISSVGISNAKSIVEANGTVFYFAKAGIYALAADPTSGRFKAESVSLTTIQTLYNSISDTAKDNAKGFYDERENRIRWLYNDTSTYSDSSYANKYNRELVLDLTIKAFYPQSISTSLSLPYVADYIDIPGYTSAIVAEDVYIDTEQVVIDSDEVYINTPIFSERSSQFSFLTIVGTTFTISKYISRTFKDWFSVDSIGVNYSSYLLTGYEMFGEVMRNKQVPYILFYFERTEDGFTDVGGNLEIDNPSSCYVQAQWNWTDSIASGRWGTPFQAYRFNRFYLPSGAADTFDYGERVIVTKNKLRGRGKSLSLKIYSEEGKDMRLLGWALTNTGSGSV